MVPWWLNRTYRDQIHSVRSRYIDRICMNCARQIPRYLNIIGIKQKMLKIMFKVGEEHGQYKQAATPS